MCGRELDTRASRTRALRAQTQFAPLQQSAPPFRCPQVAACYSFDASCVCDACIRLGLISRCVCAGACDEFGDIRGSGCVSAS
jgi:hypothetical protein